MTVETETILIKFLERIEAELKETRVSLESEIKETRVSLESEIKETRISLESEIKETNRKLDKFIETTNESLTKIQVNQAKLEGDVKILQVEVLNVKETVRDIKSTEKWVITLVLTLIGVVGTIFLRTFNLLQK